MTALSEPPDNRRVIGQKPRTALSPALVLAVVFHAAVFGAAFFLPRIFEKPPPMRQVIMARLVAQGTPRDPHLLPRKQSAAPAAPAPQPVSVPAKDSSSKTAPSTAPKKHEPTRQELMERALARAAGKATPEERDPERAGQKDGSPEGTAESAEAGDAYFTAVHDAILENYVVPSVISERERLYLNASVLAFIGPSGQLLKHEFEKKSGNAFFDAALESAIQRSKLPAPPPELQKLLRETGVVLNFKP